MAKSKTTGVLLAAALLSATVLLAGCAGGTASTGGAPASPTPTGAGAESELDALIAEAKKEGGVSVYAVFDERIVQGVQAAFTETYGVDFSYTRATAAEIAQRFSAEAEVGAPVADVILNLNDGFIMDALKSGELEPLEDADIPGYPNELADEAVLDGTAIVQLAQLAIAYNTDHVDELKGWEDLLDPSLEGKVAIGSPENGIYNSLFYSLGNEYGDDFLKDLGGQVGRVYSSGSQIIEALGSGEAYAVAGTLAAAIEAAKGQGAPVDSVVPEPTLMAPTLMALNANAPHPAAARLLAYFLTTEAGLEVLNDGPGLESPTSADVLTTGWIYNPELNAEAAEHSAEIKSALGIQ